MPVVVPSSIDIINRAMIDDRNAGQVSDLLRGSLGFSTFRNYQWQVRGTLNYDLVPDVKPSDLQILVDRTISNTWSLRFGATERLVAPKGVELLAGGIVVRLGVVRAQPLPGSLAPLPDDGRLDRERDRRGRDRSSTGGDCPGVPEDPWRESPGPGKQPPKLRGRGVVVVWRT